MYSVATQGRLASAAAVFCGRYGEVTRLARQRACCRQAVYRQAHATAALLDGDAAQRQLDQLRQEVAALRQTADDLRRQLAEAVVLDRDAQAHFAATAQAEGVSLPVARRLLAVFLRGRTPSVAALGRLAQDAGRKAAAVLAVLDEHSRPLVRDAALDELFAGRRPVLMAVELDSLCWVTGRLADRRDGATWAEQLRQLPALEFVTRDAGSGLDKGIAQHNASRRQHGRRPLDDQDDHFHLLREGTRALRRLRGQASRALDAAERAERERARVARAGHNQAGRATRAARAWRQAEAALDRWSAAERTWERVRREALPLFGPSGALNTRAEAEAVLAEALPALAGPEWSKVRRLLERPGFFTFLDRVQGELAALPAAAELGRAAVRLEGARRRPELVRGAGPPAAALRGVVLAAAVALGLAGEAGARAAALVRGVLRRGWRASSAVEGLNSVLRMQQARHRRLTQPLLDLKRLYWNCRPFRTGQRRKQTPYGRLGLRLPTTDWWQLLKIPPEELRQQLSAQRLAG